MKLAFNKLYGVTFPIKSPASVLFSIRNLFLLRVSRLSLSIIDYMYSVTTHLHFFNRNPAMEFFAKLLPIFLVLICTENCRTENHHLRSLRKWLPGLDDWKPSDDLKIDITAYHSGYDYENRTVIVMDLGKWNVPKYMRSKNPEEQMLPKLRAEKLVYSALDVDLGRNETNSNSASDYVFVVDGSGLSFQIIRDSRVLQFYIWLLRLLESVIEFAGDVFLVNVNKPLEVILGAVRPLTPKFFSIATFIGTNRETIISTLRQFIPKDQLPPEYGGSKDFQPIKIF